MLCDVLVEYLIIIQHVLSFYQSELDRWQPIQVFYEPFVKEKTELYQVIIV
jgi:hypothetical protein